MNFNKAVKLLISIIICELAGFVGVVFTTPEIGAPSGSWYKSLNKPSFNPPDGIFGPVWTTIFVLMGISLYFVWIKKWEPKNKIGPEKSKMWNSLSKKFFSGEWRRLNIILIFAIQLILNILWSITFFGGHAIDKAFFVLLMLWFAIVFTMVNFYRVSKTASLLLLPYILWVSFAGVLNFFLWILN